MILNLSPELQARVDEWAEAANRPGKELVIELLEEYLDEFDDADRLEALIEAREKEMRGEAQ